MAAGALVAAGLVAGYLGVAPGLATVALGAALLAGRSPRGVPVGDTVPGRASRRAWALAALVVGARLVAAVGGAEEDAVRWSRLAAAGETPAVQADVRISLVRRLDESRWSLRGKAVACPRPCDGATLAWRWSGEPAPAPGERWRVAGRLAVEPLRSPPGSRFPPAGLDPWARRAELLDARLLMRRPPAVPILASAEAHLRSRTRERFGVALGPLADALLLGDRAAFDPSLTDAFAVTGTLHLLSVSGLHVAFLAALIGSALRLTGSSPRRQAVAASALMAAYAALVGGQPPVVRSSLMAGAILWARAEERRVSVWQAWGAAAVGILAVRPLDLFDLGFALSFGSVGGLLALSRPLTRALEAAPAPGPRGRESPLARVGRILAVGLVATTAASAATLPIQAAAFGWIAPAGFVVNPIAVPLAGAGLPLAWLALCADAVGVELVAGPLSAAAGTALGLLEGIVALAARSAPVWVPGPVGWGGGAAVLLGASARLAGRRPAAALVVAGSALALILAARPPGGAAWEIVWLDVGQGDAIVIHFPDGAAWLVDTGPADPYGDAGRRVVLPYLRRRGVRRLEWLITTHPDLDHVGGAASVVRGVAVRRWGSGGAIADAAAYLALLAARGPGGAPEAVVLRAGDRLQQGPVRADVLHPGPGWVAVDPYAGGYPPNEASVVLLFSHGPCRLLLTGDLGKPGEASLVRALGDSLQAALLHAGHHGSRHSSTALFLDRVRPRIAIASVGRRNRHGHPHPDALGRLAAIGARVHRTDREGTIAARCRPDGWQVRATGSYLDVSAAQSAARLEPPRSQEHSLRAPGIGRDDAYVGGAHAARPRERLRDRGDARRGERPRRPRERLRDHAPR